MTQGFISPKFILKNFVPPKIYKGITSKVPISTIDILVKKKNQFLLVKRKEEPAKDKWWFAGGRVFFGEKRTDTVKRKLREELNIKSFRKIEFLKAEEVMFERNRFGRPEHNIIHLFLAEVTEKDCAKMKPDETMYGFQWFDRIKNNFPSYVRKSLKLAGFK